MKTLTLSDLIKRRLMGGNCNMTGRDENGLYARYDTLSFEVSTRKVSLKLGDEIVCTYQGVLLEGDTINFPGLDGRLRVTINV